MLNTQISPDVSALVELFTETKPGDVISYEAMTRQIGRDIQIHRWLALRALDVAARDHGAVFANERGKGYARLHPEDAHSIGATARGRVKRIARKAGKVIRYALQRQNDISPEANRKANAEISVLGLMEHISANKFAAPTETHDKRAEPVAIIAQRMMDQMR